MKNIPQAKLTCGMRYVSIKKLTKEEKENMKSEKRLHAALVNHKL
jgi:hypothetical protein